MKKLGYNGPFQEGKHPYMIKDTSVITIPNPHKSDISVGLLIRILKQAEIDIDDWNKI
jgi:predicted RNA binding protein YcfA (HicA-like mRNA interferase family)